MRQGCPLSLQGCPLSLQLFILALDGLGHMLDNLKYTIRGLSLRSDIVRYNQSFTNNTTLFFEGGGAGGTCGEENLEVVKNVLQLFCKAIWA